ncbi:MAG: polysaccharide deacetylase family protein [Myxococcales bacterium]|nr:polysaccharide deacetylase family protein [Myxococcales bacterium]
MLMLQAQGDDRRLWRALRRTWLPTMVPRRLLLLRGPRRAPRVALTFDDGPDWLTEQYLDVLDKLGLRASFFLIGRQAAAQPDLVRAYLRHGHEVFGHGYSHRRFPTLTEAELQDELARTDALLPPMPLRLVRPPRGALDARTLFRCAHFGYTLALWSLDSLDHRLTDADALLARLRHRPPEGGEILLLHEGQTWTLSALPGIAALLRAQGLVAVPLSELFDHG